MTRIYGEGDTTTSFAFILGFGNNVIFEVETVYGLIQIYGEFPLLVNRSYHLFMTFEGNSHGNFVHAYIDGILQSRSIPSIPEPGYAELPTHGGNFFGKPTKNTSIGGTSILLVAPDTGKYNQWASWTGSGASITSTQIRKTLFEKGAIPTILISSDTLVNMQNQFDGYNNTTRPDSPLAFEIEQPTDYPGTFELVSTSVVFKPRISLHVLFTGTGSLIIKNRGTSNTSIVSASNGGQVTILKEIHINIKVIDSQTKEVIVGARVYLKSAAGGHLPVGQVLLSTVTDVSGVASNTMFNNGHQPFTGVVRRSTGGKLYKSRTVSGNLDDVDLTETILLLNDE